MPNRGLDEIAADLGYSVEAVELVASVTNVMEWHVINAGMCEMPHLSARGFCQLFRTDVRAMYGVSAAAVLRGWGVTRSEDIGRIVFALVASGWLEASADDAITDFDGLFTVGDYFV